jgi:hypothetical protein
MSHTSILRMCKYINDCNGITGRGISDLWGYNGSRIVDHDLVGCDTLWSIIKETICSSETSVATRKSTGVTTQKTNVDNPRAAANY